MCQSIYEMSCVGYHILRGSILYSFFPYFCKVQYACICLIDNYSMEYTV